MTCFRGAKDDYTKIKRPEQVHRIVQSALIQNTKLAEQWGQNDEDTSFDLFKLLIIVLIILPTSFCQYGVNLTRMQLDARCVQNLISACSGPGELAGVSQSIAMPSSEGISLPPVADHARGQGASRIVPRAPTGVEGYCPRLLAIP
jgi:hypothetical protein